MASDQKVSGRILCLLLGRNAGALYHLHIWTFCGHGAHSRRSHGTTTTLKCYPRNFFEYICRCCVSRLVISFYSIVTLIRHTREPLLAIPDLSVFCYITVKVSDLDLTTFAHEQVFTSLALFDILTGPLNNFPWVINSIVEVTPASLLLV